LKILSSKFSIIGVFYSKSSLYLYTNESYKWRIWESQIEYTIKLIKPKFGAILLNMIGCRAWRAMALIIHFHYPCVKLSQCKGCTYSKLDFVHCPTLIFPHFTLIYVNYYWGWSTNFLVIVVDYNNSKNYTPHEFKIFIFQGYFQSLQVFQPKI